MAVVEIRREITDEAGTRLDHLVRDLTGRSRSEIRALFQQECVQLNGEVSQEHGRLLQAGDVVQIRHDPHTKYHEQTRVRENRAFRLVMEDDYLLVVDKTPAVLTVPTDQGEENTLLDAVNFYLRSQRRQAFAVHRLDRGTSGLLVFAKQPQVAEELEGQFRLHTVERDYAAFVAGEVRPASGTYRSRLGTNKNLQRYSVGEQEAGELAISHYRVERRLPGATYVHVRLETGRRNQIRVQFAEAGHPVLGDQRYQRKRAVHPAWKPHRLALHARQLGFVHPHTKELLRFESPLPPEFERFLNRAGKPPKSTQE